MIEDITTMMAFICQEWVHPWAR